MGEISVHFDCCASIGFVRFLFSFKDTKLFASDLRPPYASGLMIKRTDHSRRVATGKPAIPLIFSAGSKTKIAPSVVYRIAVPMVNFSIRPSASHVEPREPMGEIDLAINADVTDESSLPASYSVYRPGNAIFPLSSRPFLYPAKLSSFCVVMQRFAHTLCRQVRFPPVSRCWYKTKSHDLLLRSRLGLGAAGGCEPPVAPLG